MFKILFWPILGWAFFFLGFNLAEGIRLTAKAQLLICSPGIVCFVLWLFLSRKSRVRSLLSRYMEQHTDSMDALSYDKTGLWIALAAALSLYAEMSVVRLHASYFAVFAFYKNISLLSCFLGLGIGYALGAKRPLLTPIAIPLLAFQIIFLYFLRLSQLGDWMQNPVVEFLSMGLKQADALNHILIVYGMLIFTFSLNALCFIPLGQLVSRLMLHKEKLTAYSWNLIGSIAGIVVFSFLSFLWTPPSVWIFIAVVGFMVLVYGLQAT
jgi:hypothetical protein